MKTWIAIIYVCLHSKNIKKLEHKNLFGKRILTY